MGNRLSSLLNGLVREIRRQQQAEPEANRDTEYQSMIDQANAESECVELVRDLRERI